MASRKDVPAAEVRAWGAEHPNLVPDEARASFFGTTDTGPRGRLNPKGVAAFHKHNKSKRYTEKVAEARTVETSYPGVDKSGRGRTVKETLTTGEARALLGQPTARRGRIAKDDLSLAAGARYAETVADRF